MKYKNLILSINSLSSLCHERINGVKNIEDQEFEKLYCNIIGHLESYKKEINNQEIKELILLYPSIKFDVKRIGYIALILGILMCLISIILYFIFEKYGLTILSIFAAGYVIVLVAVSVFSSKRKKHLKKIIDINTKVIEIIKQNVIRMK